MASVFCVFALVAAFLGVQTAENSGATTAVSTVRSYLVANKRLEAEFPLEATRIPALSYQLIDISGPVREGEAVPLVDFFRVGHPPYGLDKGVVTGSFAAVDGEEEWLVGIERGSGVSFLLRGGPAPRSAFSQLAQRLAVRVADEAAALRLFQLYLACVADDATDLVSDEMTLHLAAAKDIVAHVARAKRMTVFDAWWNTVPRAAKNRIGAPSVAAVKGGFIVTYFVYVRGCVQQCSVRVNADGSVADMGTKASIAGHCKGE